MTEAKLQQLVKLGVQLARDVTEAENRLKEVKALLVAEAAGREDEHLDTDGGGRSWTALGPDGSLARVTFPAPSLKSRIDGEGKSIEKIRAAAGKAFERLFRPSVSYKPCENFRVETEAVLGKAAGKLVRLCESEGGPKVAFEVKETV